MSIRKILTTLALAFAPVAFAADPLGVAGDKFRQLDELLPTPNVYRTGSGTPGHAYWQQQADYKIDVHLNDEIQQLTGKATINYKNNSPDTLRYLWVALDQNRYKPDSIQNQHKTVSISNGEPKIPYGSFRAKVVGDQFDGGNKIKAVTNAKGEKIPYSVIDTMMRIDLPKPLKSGEETTFTIDWTHNIAEQKVLGGRGGYEYFERDDNYLYEIAQWFPRMAAYTDLTGWNNKAFVGRGEFTLEFGDYEVAITVPADHIVAATGELANAKEVLTSKQRSRLNKAKSSDVPVYIVTLDEALENEKSRAKSEKTWVFKAKNVRDFAWASSRKFLWDAMGVKSGDQTVLAMSYYPEEGTPLWDKYSTRSIVHTINHYNRYSFDYPYPVAISVNGPVGGMEYPMITFNGPRPEIDEDDRSNRTWSRRTKYGLISVIIHEVGHIYFPMIVNTDERQWTWMDEGINTYLQFLAEQEWEENYPSRRGDARKIIPYMRSSNQMPIMTNSESVLQFGNNAYGKPATALNILRETVVGREQFDFAFRQYAEMWKFKRPYPADLFRLLEDASGTDLDWFWRGWFYTTDNVDISIDNVRHYTIDSQNPDVESEYDRAKFNKEPKSISDQRNADIHTLLEERPELADFYNENDQFSVTNKDRNKYNSMLKGLKPHERELLASEHNIYVFDFSNIGGLVMPIILNLEYSDGTSEELRLPVETWVRNSEKVSTMIVRNADKLLTDVTLDPHWETADVNVHNNHYPRKIMPSRLELYKGSKRKNMMKDAQTKLKTDDDKEDEE